jgi:type II secretory pathway pseudopilin PulG
MRRARGFSLIEMVMIIVLLSLASVPLVTMFTRSAGGMQSDVSIQTAAQLVQECGEYVLGLRRRAATTLAGYAAVTAATTCVGLAVPTGYSFSALTVTDPYAVAPCPTGGTCKRVQITVNGPGTLQATGDLVLVSY